MCGIIAYKGNGDAVRVVLDGLKSLEYRGYDSWGIALQAGTGLSVIKKVGRISAEDMGAAHEGCHLAVGHTRWATHGGICERNAHPHLSADGRIAVVHNGIIENYQELRGELTERGHTFVSETDTEVVSHLVRDELTHHALPEALRSVFRRLEGRNAVVVLDTKTGELVGVRDGSPLVFGVGKNEYFIASDVPAFLEHTRDVIFLNDCEMVCVGDGYSIMSVDTGDSIERAPTRVGWDIAQAQKGNQPYFMIKEILEQPEALMQSLAQDSAQLEGAVSAIRSARTVILVGCGTAGKVAQIGQYLLATIAGMNVQVAFGSEFSPLKPVINSDSVLVTISQSGETADLLEVVRYAKPKGVKIVSLVNVMGSTLYRLSDFPLLIHAGPEKAVASTKATLNQIALMLVIAHACAGSPDAGVRLVESASAALKPLLEERQREPIARLAAELQDVHDIYIIGRGVSYPVAQEAGIKIQEVSYIHAEGVAGGELKHYAIALVQRHTPVIVLAPNDESFKEIISNAIEVKSRGGYIIGVSPVENEAFDCHIKVPDLGLASPLAMLPPMQLLAYYLTIARGFDPDYPRNLAKSVTVK